MTESYRLLNDRLNLSNFFLTGKLKMKMHYEMINHPRKRGMENVVSIPNTKCIENEHFLKFYSHKLLIIINLYSGMLSTYTIRENFAFTK